ncbi:MAG TPA: SDR family oxidoreductase [Sphingomonadaceae bacterium]|nr:SDR family oxidoreductase [Sphingomonadaceae bacterium]
MTNTPPLRVLVAGGTGDVGEGIVRALLDRDFAVVVPVRAKEKGDRLLDAIGQTDQLALIPGAVGELEGAQVLAQLVAASGPLNAVVASLGGWWQGGPLVGVSAEEWHQVIADNLTSHYAVARAFVPLLQRSGGTYVQILGAAAEFPVPNSSLVSITAAAVAMLGRSLHAESEGTGVRVRQIMIAALVATRSRPATDVTGVSAEEVGALAAELIADEHGSAPLVSRLPRSG